MNDPTGKPENVTDNPNYPLDPDPEKRSEQLQEIKEQQDQSQPGHDQGDRTPEEQTDAADPTD